MTNEDNIADKDLALIYSMIYLYECRDETTEIHLERISIFTKLLAAQLAKHQNYSDYIDDEYIKTVEIASMLHDIGKIGVSELILNKKSTLNSEERLIIKKHPLVGAEKIYKLMKQFPGNPWYEMSASIIRSHHERYDGTGYPDGLKGDSIPLSARIVAVADVYEALRSERSYKPSYSHKKSLHIIQQWRGTHFDPDIVDSFLISEKEFENVYLITQ